MEVIVHSTLPTVGGHVTVSADPNHTVDSLITAFCIEKGIPHRKEYLIRNRDQKDLWDGDKLTACGIANGETVFLCLKDEHRGWPRGCNQWLVLAVVTLFIGAIGISAISVIRINESAQPLDYGVVLDAGSSHTQLFVYQWDAVKENGTGIVEQIHTCKAVGSGISKYTSNPEMAGKSLKPCLDEAVRQVPDHAMKTTPIFLGATAGMRLLRDSGDNATSEAILNSVRSVFKDSPFYFNNSAKQVRIISGSDEGTYSWITTNYLSQTFGDFVDQLYGLVGYTINTPMHATHGALDLGGASTQNTFIPENASAIPPGYSESLFLFGDNYDVYTHSYLCYGLNEAYRQYLAYLVKNQSYALNISSPCGPTGNTTTFHYRDIFEAPCTNSTAPKNITDKNITYTFIGQNNNDQCGEFVKNNLFDFNTICKDEPCSFNGVHQPPVYGTFYAFSAFYLNMNFLNVSTSKSLVRFENATADICSKSYTELLAYHDDPMYLIKYCFNAHFIHTLLVDGYKFNETTWKNIEFTDNIKKSDLGWSLGFMLNATNRFPERHQMYTFSVAVFVILILLFVVCVLLGMFFCCYATQERKQSAFNRYKRMSYGSLSP